MAKTGYVGIGDVAHKIKSIYVGVDGVAHKVKSAYIGVNGIARQWYASGTPIGSLDVGSIVKIKVNNVLTDFLVVNQGIPQNSSLYDSSCDGTWLLRKNLYSGIFNSSRSNIYATSELNTNLNGDYFNSLGRAEQAAIKLVKIPYVDWNTTPGTIKSGVDGLEVKVFLLSTFEVGWTEADHENYPKTGAKLDYFPSGNAEDNTIRIGYFDNGKSEVWWLRDPYNMTGTSRYEWVVSDTTSQDPGYAPTSADVREPYGVRPAFILPKDTLINPETMEIVV